MFGNAFTGWHLLIIIAVVVLLFGAPKLPGLARSLGQSMRIFRSEIKTMKEESTEAKPDAATNTASTTVASTSVTEAQPAATESSAKIQGDQKPSS